MLVTLALPLTLSREREDDRAAILGIGLAANEILLYERLDELADGRGGQLEVLCEQTGAQGMRTENEEQAATLRRAETALVRGAPRDAPEVGRDRQQAPRQLEWFVRRPSPRKSFAHYIPSVAK